MCTRATSSYRLIHQHHFLADEFGSFSSEGRCGRVQ
uniref:Uncharacterized protein n=1 Tax=Triticum urartu TaxID=4572 RepID=A0A8R7UR07_TRIUA